MNISRSAISRLDWPLIPCQQTPIEMVKSVYSFEVLNQLSCLITKRMHSVRVAFAAVLVCILIFGCAPAQQQTCPPSPLAFIAHIDCALSCLAYSLSLCLGQLLIANALTASITEVQQSRWGWECIKGHNSRQEHQTTWIEAGQACSCSTQKHWIQCIVSYTCVLNLQSVFS